MAPKREPNTDYDAVFVPEQKHVVEQNHVQSGSKVKKDDENDENDNSRELGLTGIVNLKNFDHRDIIIPSYVFHRLFFKFYK